MGDIISNMQLVISETVVGPTQAEPFSWSRQRFSLFSIGMVCADISESRRNRIQDLVDKSEVSGSSSDSRDSSKLGPHQNGDIILTDPRVMNTTMGLAPVKYFHFPWLMVRGRSTHNKGLWAPIGRVFVR